MPQHKKFLLIKLSLVVLFVSCGYTVFNGRSVHRGIKQDIAVAQESAPYEYQIALHTPPNTLNPHQTSDNILASVLFLPYDTLLMIDATGHYTSSLADAENIHSPNETSYIFNLRKDVHFHNGDPFTAASMLYSWQYGKQNESDPWNVINDVGIVDEYTIQITPTDVISKDLFLNQVAPSLIILHPTSTITQPVGTGAYRLVHWAMNDAIQLEKNDNYWDQRQHTEIQRINFQFISSVSATTLLPMDVMFNLQDTQTASIEPVNYQTFTTTVFVSSRYIHRCDVDRLFEQDCTEISNALRWSIDPATEVTIQNNHPSVTYRKSWKYDPKGDYLFDSRIVRDTLEDKWNQIAIYEASADPLPYTEPLSSGLSNSSGLEVVLSNSYDRTEIDTIPVIGESSIGFDQPPSFANTSTRDNSSIYEATSREVLITSIRTNAPDNEALQDLLRRICGPCNTNPSDPKGNPPKATPVPAPKPVIGPIVISTRKPTSTPTRRRQ